MTCRERLAIEHPDRISDDHWGGCLGCPSEFGYLPDPEECPKEHMVDDFDKTCRECWDRETAGNKSNQHTIMGIDILDLLNDAMKKRDRSVTIYFHPKKGMNVNVYPWPDTEDLLDLFKSGKISMDELRAMTGFPTIKDEQE